MLDFATLERPSTPNTCLVLPPGFESRARADWTAPIFEAPSERLEAALIALARDEPRTRRGASDPEARRYCFVQRSRILRFPDEITAQIFDAGTQRSTLAIYSRARCGISDFGVNRSRVRRWLTALGERLRQD